MTKYKYGYKDCIQLKEDWFDKADKYATIIGVATMIILFTLTLRAVLISL